MDLVRRRILQASLLAVNVAVVTTWLAMGQGPNVQPVGRDDLFDVLPVLLWWNAPLLVLFLHRSWPGSLLTGVVLLVANVIGLASIYASTHSTAGIGFLALPVLS